MQFSRVLLCLWVLLYCATAQTADERNRTFPANNTTSWIQCNATTNSSVGCACNATTTTNTIKVDKAFLVIQLTLYALVFIVGVIGNILVLLTVTSKKMRSVKNLLIGNLAIADLITLVVCLPITIVGLFVPWPFGIYVCKYVFPLLDVVVSASVVTLTVISLDRFRAIVYPFAKKMSLKTTVMVTVVIWVASYVVIALPINHIMVLKLLKTCTISCSIAWPSKSYQQGYRLVVLVVLYIIPVCLIFFCFVCIGRKIKQNMKFTRESVRDTRSLAKIGRRVRLVKIMLVIFLTFTLCLLPIHLVLTLITFYEPMKKWAQLPEAYHVCILILVANSSMNPIILYILSSDFKKSFKEKCLCLSVYTRFKEGRKRPNVFCNVREPSTSYTTGCVQVTFKGGAAMNRNEPVSNEKVFL